MIDPFSSLPKDMVQEIMSYLSPDEISQFKLACKGFNTTANSTRLDVLWQPFLNQLNQLDPNVSVIPPKDVAPDSAWRFSLFKRNFKRIAEQQIKDIENILKVINDIGEVTLTPELTKQVETLKLPTNKMAQLKERAALIEDLNMLLIKKRWKPGHSYQNFNSLGITSFPKTMFTNDEFRNALLNVTTIECVGNYLKAIPDELIAACPNLTRLYCNDNLISEFSVAFKKQFGDWWADDMTVSQFSGLPRSEPEVDQTADIETPATKPKP